MSAVDDIAFLSGSERRVEILRHLLDEAPQTRAELRRACDGADVTVSRNLEKLADRGWVEEHDLEYTLTLQGTEILDRYLDLVDAVERINRLDPFLRWVPEEEFDLHVGALSDVDVTIGEKHCPFAPIDEYVELLQGANEARILLQPVGLAALAAARDAIFESDPRLTVVVERDVVRTQDRGGDRFSVLQELLDCERSAVRVYGGDVPLCLVVTDRTVQFGAQDEHNHPRAIVQTESDAAREWARAKFADFWQRAEPMSPDVLE